MVYVLWSVAMVVDIARIQCTCGVCLTWSVAMVVDIARTQCTCGVCLTWSVAMVVDIARTPFNKGAIFNMLQSSVITANVNHPSCKRYQPKLLPGELHFMSTCEPCSETEQQIKVILEVIRSVQCPLSYNCC